ncbi:MAG TPA: outer membrane beta-barrel protein [Kofleriaceae bacterium]|jgi:hypothetical protein|nr:outer membrane beta-barrel protein [Kofleriaceae bacterium]
MRFWTLASLAPLFAAPLAHAQAPGEDVQPVVAPPVVVQPVVVAPVFAPATIGPPGMAPVVAPAPPPEAGCGCELREPVMANRWAIGFSVGGMSLAPRDTPDDQTHFAIGELALRFRVARHFELEAAVGGGREQTADHMDGDLEVTTASLALRYRFRPEARWNWYVLGGIGAASLASHDATSQQRNDATQPMGLLGIGTEYRFDHFALQAELRAMGLGKAHPDSTSDAAATPMASGPAPIDPGNTADIERSGASLSVGVSYYF